MFLNLLTVFNSVLGPVKSNELNESLQLMGLGMLGIFIVMLLIFLVIVFLGKTTHDKDD